MKYCKKCKGCGVVLQNDNDTKIGYVPMLESLICKKCYRAKNYGEFQNNLNTFYKLEEIKEIIDDNVIMIVDILNPFETMIQNINDFVKQENLIVLINKIDILPKSIPKEAIIDWIAEIADQKNICFNHLALVSATKKTNIDSILEFILSSEKDTAFIGYSNVGKSSIITSLFRAIGEDVENLITNSIGTTKEIIHLQYKDKNIKDYPGIILEGSYQNLMNIKQLKETHPKKEIKLTNYQLGEKQTITIGDYAMFSIKEQKGNLGYQFTFSNLIKLHRGKNKEFPGMETHVIEHKMGTRYDLVISGLGIITFKSHFQELELNIPKGIKFNLIRSLYQ